MHLDDEDFKVLYIGAEKIPTFSLMRDEPTMVLFYSRTCESCKEYERLFANPRFASECGVAVGAFELFASTPAVKLSRVTGTPLLTVPTVFLFRKGLPPAEYPARDDVRDRYFKEFLLECQEAPPDKAVPKNADSSGYRSRSGVYCLIDF